MEYFIKAYGHTGRWYGLLLFIVSFSLSVQGQSNNTSASATSLYNEGLGALKEKNYEAGLDLMIKALAKAEEENQEKVLDLARKNGSVAAYNVGNDKRKNGELDAAIDFFAIGIELNPENASNYLGKAMTMEEKGVNVESLLAYMEAASAYISAEQEDRAEKMNIKAKNFIVKAFIDKNYDFVIEGGKAYLDVMPNADIHYYIGKSLAEKNMNDAALKHLSESITLSEGDAEADFDKFYYAKAQVLESLNKIEEAISTYKKIKGDKYKDQVEYKIQNLGSN
ncbi:MAG TPA: hypothetical protein PKC30_08770 [Saprospiraceae bacterium]|nr:hypothetical protein [Saprospiraceae bacterium]